MDHIHAIQQIMQKCAEYNKHLYFAFIEYEKAYDSVQTAAVVAALRDPGFEIRLLEDIYHDCTGTIILHKNSEKILIIKGVKQGGTISIEFYGFLESVFGKVDEETLGV